MKSYQSKSSESYNADLKNISSQFIKRYDTNNDNKITYNVLVDATNNIKNMNNDLRPINTLPNFKRFSIPLEVIGCQLKRAIEEAPLIL